MGKGEREFGLTRNEVKVNPKYTLAFPLCNRTVGLFRKNPNKSELFCPSAERVVQTPH
jgi:hypothetical protein